MFKISFWIHINEHFILLIDLETQRWWNTIDARCGSRFPPWPRNNLPAWIYLLNLSRWRRMSRFSGHFTSNRWGNSLCKFEPSAHGPLRRNGDQSRQHLAGRSPYVFPDCVFARQWKLPNCRTPSRFHISNNMVFLKGNCIYF